MITVLTMAFTYYLKIPFENFSEKYVNAMGLFQVIDNPDEKLINEMKKIEEYTHPKIKLSLYKLDRVVNPTKGDFNPVDHKFKFIRELPGLESEEITLTENEIQHYLCMALRRVHEIVLCALKSYKIEQSMDEDSSESTKEDIKLLEV